jgi:serine/threonine protein kinase/WD40 repeat protein
MPDRDDLAGKHIGNYRIIRRIGSGGFAEVYLGQQLYLNSLAAIKLLHATLDPRSAENFRREARILSKLRHPHIISLFDFGVEPEHGQPYLIMDYAPGGSLRERYPTGRRVSLTEIVKAVDQAAGALEFAHNQGFVHRDVKPANMLIGERGEVLLSDFGIAGTLPAGDARLSGDSLWRRSFPGVVGTPAYMAPEQIEGKTSPASDQYSLATVVYQWLCGSLPFEGKSWAEVMVKHVREDPRPLHDFIPAIPRDLEDVIMTGLAREAEHRYASVRAFADALTEAALPLDQRTTLPPGTGVDARFIAPPRPSTGRSIPINRASAVNPTTPIPPRASAGQHVSGVDANDDATPLSGIVTGAGPRHTASEVSQGGGGRMPARSRPPQPSPTPTLLLGRRTILAGMGAVVVAAGLGFALTRAPYVLNEPRASAQNSHHPAATRTTNTPAARKTQGTTNTNIPALTTLHIYSGHSDIVDAVAWSPDGHYIVSGSRDQTAQLWDANSAQHLLTHQHNDIVSSVTWSSDSQLIASGSFDKTAQVWGVNQGAGATVTYNILNKIVSSVSWSPVAARVTASSLDGDEVDIFDPTTGNNITFYHLQSNNTYAASWSHDGTRIATGSGGGVGASVQIWDVTTNSRIASFTGHTGGVFSVSWSPDGRYVASGGFDKTVRIWEIASGNQVQMYEGHHDVVNAVAWSPDGRYVASAGNDRTVQVWTAAAGIPLHTYSQHLDSVRAIAWSPDNTRIASASSDKTVRVWQAV